MTTALEDAIQACVVAASGYPGANVIWSYQDGPRPTDPFITLALTSQDTDGAFDQVDYDVDLTRPSGQEVELTVTGWREVYVTLQAFTHVVSGDGSALDVLTDIQTKLGLPSIRAILGAQGLGPTFDRGSIQPLPKLLGTSRFESRATVTIGMYRAVTASERTTYIDTVSGQGDLQGVVDPNVGTVDITTTGS